MNDKEFRFSVIILLSTIVLALGMGAIIFSAIEGWSMLDALYFVTVTATTIGYGDLTPTHALSKVVTMLYALSIIPLVLYIFSLIAKQQIEHIYKKVHTLEKKHEEYEKNVKKAEKKLEDQQHKIKNQGKELEQQEKKIKQQSRELTTQEKEIGVQEKELEVVEDIMEGALAGKK